MKNRLPAVFFMGKLRLQHADGGGVERGWQGDVGV